MRVTSTCAPLGVYLSLSTSSFASSSSASVSSPLYVASWLSSLLRGEVLMTRPPMPFLPPPPLPPLLLSLPPLPLTPGVVQVCHLWCAGDWALGGICPVGELTI